MMMMRRGARGGVLLGLCLLVAVAVPGVASAGERTSGDTVARMAIAHYAGSGPSVQSAGLCNKTLWKSGRMKKSKLTRRLDKAIDIANKVDSAATYVSLITGIIGSPASGAVVKLVAKAGKGVIVKVLKSTLKKVRKIRVTKKRNKVGVKIRTKCKFVLIYPTISAYT